MRNVKNWHEGVGIFLSRALLCVIAGLAWHYHYHSIAFAMALYILDPA